MFDASEVKTMYVTIVLALKYYYDTLFWILKQMELFICAAWKMVPNGTSRAANQPFRPLAINKPFFDHFQTTV